MATSFRLNPVTIKEVLKTNDVREQTRRPLQFKTRRPQILQSRRRQTFNRVQAEAEGDLDTMEHKLSAYHKDSETATRLESLENFMQAQQAVQISMQKQQADFLEQQAIAMQQVLQQMGPTTTKSLTMQVESTPLEPTQDLQELIDESKYDDEWV